MTMITKGYKDLTVWKKSMVLANYIYDLTESFPQHQQYRLVDQMQRSAISIPSNIAEGSKRGSLKDYSRFLAIAYASGAELETQIQLSQMRKYGDSDLSEKSVSLLDEIMRMLYKMIQTTKK